MERTDNSSYRRIDDLPAYVRELEEDGALVIMAEKSARIAARRGEPGEQVLSWSADSRGTPILEKASIVSKDEETGLPDWVASKVDGHGAPAVDQNGKRNEWVISDGVFRQKYEADPDAPGLFRPVGGLQRFIRLREAVEILQWGEEWRVDAGGFINITDREDLYVISKRDFTDTYRICREEAGPLTDRQSAGCCPDPASETGRNPRRQSF